MQAQQLNLNVISNNIANVNTTGFKKNKIEFDDRAISYNCLTVSAKKKKRPNHLI